MLLAAAVLTLSIEIDLTGLLRRYSDPRSPDGIACGIKVVGYHITGRPGQKFGYARETFTIPAEGFVEVIALPRVKHYTFEGRKHPLEDGVSPLGPFSFRWITLPASPDPTGGK